jgi:hypothetical protein
MDSEYKSPDNINDLNDMDLDDNQMDNQMEDDMDG